MPFRSSSIQSKLLPSDDDFDFDPDFSTSLSPKATSKPTINSSPGPNTPSRPSIDTTFSDVPSLFQRPNPVSPTLISPHPSTSPSSPSSSIISPTSSYFASHAWWNKNKFSPLKRTYTPPLEPILEYEIEKDGRREWMTRESRAKIELVVTASLAVGLFVLVMWCVAWGTGISVKDGGVTAEFYG